MFSLLSPPLLLAHSLYKRSFRLSPFLRNTFLSTFLLGGSFGAALGAGRMYGMDLEGARERAERLRYNVGQRRVDDWSVIGAVLGSVSSCLALGRGGTDEVQLVTTTVLLRRAPVLWVVGGGAAFGIAGGVGMHVVRNWQQGTATGVGMMVEEGRGAVKGP